MLREGTLPEKVEEQLRITYGIGLPVSGHASAPVAVPSAASASASASCDASAQEVSLESLNRYNIAKLEDARLVDHARIAELEKARLEHADKIRDLQIELKTYSELLAARDQWRVWEDDSIAWNSRSAWDRSSCDSDPGGVVWNVSDPWNSWNPQ